MLAAAYNTLDNGLESTESNELPLYSNAFQSRAKTRLTCINPTYEPEDREWIAP